MEKNIKSANVISLTKDEFIEKYGDVMLTFSSYMKYIFVFKGEYENKTIYVNVGGTYHDIYRLNIESGVEYMVKNLDFFYGEAKDKNNFREIFV